MQNMQSSKLPEIVPFGKYKGKPVEALQQDAQYCDWLMAQDWFNSRYGGLKTLIVNNFQEASETPEHNKLQGLFLDNDFCTAIGYLLHPVTKKTYESNISWKKREIEHIDRYRSSSNPSELALAIEKNLKIDFVIKLVSGDAQFENRGIDASFFVEQVEFPNAGGLSWGKKYSVEIKPSVGDDYPATIRQILSKKESLNKDPHVTFGAAVLFYTEYTGSGITEDMMRKMMSRQGIYTVRLDEVELKLKELKNNCEVQA